MKFKVGDKVKCIREEDCNETIIGKIGIIKKVFSGYQTYGIQFAVNINGHEGDWGGPYGYCWNIRASSLKLVGTQKLDLSHIKPYGIVAFMERTVK